MTEMNRQIQQKFDTVINLRLSQVEGLIQRTPPKAYTYGSKLIEELQTGASVRDFQYLALYNDDGQCKKIYGEDIVPFDEKEFRKILEHNDKQISRGHTAEGHNMLLLSCFSLPRLLYFDCSLQLFHTLCRLSIYVCIS